MCIFFHLIHTIFRDLVIHVSLKMGHLLVATTSQYLVYWNTLVLFDLMEVKYCWSTSIVCRPS